MIGIIHESWAMRYQEAIDHIDANTLKVVDAMPGGAVLYTSTRDGRKVAIQRGHQGRYLVDFDPSGAPPGAESVGLYGKLPYFIDLPDGKVAQRGKPA